MKRRFASIALTAAAALLVASQLPACGEKFLVAGRGTRYQRPKNFRAASILIYSNPSSGLETALRKLPIESVLKREGHRFATAATPEQLSAVLASGRFDVVLASSGDAPILERLFDGRADAPIVLSVCLKGQEQPVAQGAVCSLKAPTKERHLLEAIDKAVERHDARKVAVRS